MTTIEADPTLPIIRITRDFRATPAQLLRAHTDPALFVRWIGPDSLDNRIDYWDARTGGRWRFVSSRDGEEFAFHGSFHEIRPDRIVQTFTWEGDPDGVSLETLRFTDLGDGRTAVVIRQRHVPEAMRTPEAQAGFLTSLDKLADHLAHLTHGDRS